MNPLKKIFKKCTVMLLLCGSHYVLAENVLGVSKNTACLGESVDFWDDFGELNQSEETNIFTIDFSDGTIESSNQKHCYFQHVFLKEGDFKVQLKVFKGTMTIVADTIIHVRKDLTPMSFIDVSKNTLKTICPGTEVYFQTDWNQNYSFDYGDGSTGTSGVHIYQNSGTYRPMVVVRNVCGNEAKIEGDTITVSNQNTFLQYADAYIEDLPVHSKGFFVNKAVKFKSMTAHTYLWDFGDGATSISQNPEHSYTNPGKYAIRLTLQDACLNDTIIQLALTVNQDNIKEELLIEDNIKEALEVYPNPNKGEINIRINIGERKNARLELYDPTGTLMRQINIGPLFGEKCEKVFLTAPRTGLYDLYLISESEAYHQKIVIEK